MQTREEWLEGRKLGIGGSEVASVMGMSPWKSALQLWLEKTGAVEEQDLSANESVYWGTVLEETVAQEFQKRHPELEVINENLTITNSLYPHMIGTIDRWVKEVDGNMVGLEIKTAGNHASKEWEGDAVPTHYLCQVMHYMAVTGANKWYVACLIGGQKYVERLVLRDDAFIASLIEAEQKFWQMVQDCTPPDVDGSESSAGALKQMFPASMTDKTIQLPEDAQDWILLKKSYEKANDEYEAMIRVLNNKLIQAIGDAEIGKVGKYTVSYKSNKAGHRTMRIKEEKE